jgi:hypothetical protein
LVGRGRGVRGRACERDLGVVVVAVVVCARVFGVCTST